MTGSGETKPTAIDVFAGAGGLSLGLIWAGFDLKFALDLDEASVRTYRRNFSHNVAQLDVLTVSGADLLAAAGLEKGELGLLAGGPPCQGFSIQRRGDDDDDRNNLVLEFARLVKETRPEFFLMENVLGIKNRRGKKVFSAFRDLMESAGYYCHVQVLNAADYGVPQIRKRVFVVGERTDGVGVYFRFPEPSHRPENWVTVRQAIGDLPPPPEDGSEHPNWPNHRRERLSAINRLRISFVPEGGGREHIPPELQLRCHRVSVEKAGHRYVYGRLAWDEPAGTITARFDSFTRGKFAHPSENRTITLREGARLQTFPDWFVFEGSKVAIARQIGNAVPPLLAKALGEAIIRAMQERRSGASALAINDAQMQLSLPLV